MNKHIHSLPRKCVRCGKEYVPSHGPQKYCSYECSREAFLEINRPYQRAWNKHKREIEGDRINAIRRQGRHRIQEMWGYANTRHLGPHGGIKAELFALEELRKYGFEGIYHLNVLFGGFPFDIRATKDGKLCLIQVTMRTHSRQTNHRILAELFGADLYIFFVKPDLTKSILRRVNSNCPELSLREVLA